MVTINATVLSAGDEEQFGGFFTAGWEYLDSQLDAMGITAQCGDILNTDIAHCMAALSEATRNSELIIILTAPQPRTATLVAALLAKGLGLKLQLSDKAREYVQLHAQRVATPLSHEDEEAYCTMPAGAVTLQNPLGYLQGYAITARRQLLLVLPAAPSELQGSFASYVGELITRFASSATPQTVTAGAAVQPSGLATPPVHTRDLDPAPRTQADTVVEVCRALEQAGLTIATAESGTSGALAQTLGSCQSNCLNPANSFVGREALESLDIPSDILATHGAISPQAAAALALAARSHAGTSLGVAVTCTSPKAQGKQIAYLAVTDGKKVWRKTCTGNNHQLKLGAVLEALGILNLYARGSGLTDGISAAAAVTAAGTAVQSTGLAGRTGGKLGSLLSRRGGNPAGQGNGGEGMARTNLIQRLRRGKLTRNDKIRLGAVSIFLCVFVGCIVYIGTVFGESANNLKMTDELKNLFSDSTEVPDSIKDSYPKSYQTKFAQLYAQNPDIAGWIKIDNTKVDYPVVQTSDNIFYERKDFTGKYNDHGIPFVDFRTDNHAPSTNTVIYAHNMNDGQMFGELLNYKSLSYYKANPIVQYDSVYRDGDYKIFGIVLCKKDDPDFNYHNYIDKAGDKDMTEYVTKIRERSLINTGVEVRTSDELLTMSTCDYDFKSATGERIARFVVFARRVREGESLDTDTTKATINTNPVMPKEWYDTLAKQQEAELKKQAEVQAATVNKKWLTEDELTSLTPEEQKTVAASREADAGKYLTSDEQSYMAIDEMIYTIRARKQEFTLFLTTTEQGDLSLKSRISTSEERAALASEYLSDEEIKTAGKWSRIDALIKERQKQSSTTVPDEAKWLTAEEIKTLSVDDKKAYIAQRRADAKAAGVTDAEIAKTKTWAEMQKLMESKTPTQTPEQYIKLNAPWLDSNDTGLTVEELKSVMANRRQSAKAAGVDGSKYRTWAELSAAIDLVNASKGEAAKITELIKNNPAWLSTADAAGKTLVQVQVQELLNTRHKMATDVGLDPAAMTTKTWAETKAAIDKKKAENDANAGAKEQERQAYIAAHLPYLNEGEKGKTLAELKALVDPRIAKVPAGVDVSASHSWTESEKIIKDSQAPPVVDPNPPVDPTKPPVDPTKPPVDPTKPPVVPPESSSTPVDPPVTPPNNPTGVSP